MRTAYPPRYNGHGRVHCRACKQYLAPDSFAWQTCPSLPKPRYNPYCRPCQRQMDRMRWRGERRATNNASRLVRQKRNKQRVARQQREFAAHLVKLLRRRGLTKSEIARLTGTHITSVMAWEHQARQVTPNAVSRLTVVVQATAHLPLAERGAYRRRLPHPELPALMRACRSRIETYPLRKGSSPREVAS